MKPSKITPKTKKTVDIVVTVLQIVIVLIAIIISAIVIANPITSSAEVSGGKIKLLPVLSNSMAGTEKTSFKEGDLLVSKTPSDNQGLQVGDIITFVGSVNGTDQLITHRIIRVVPDSDGNANTYITRGDANPDEMTETVNPLKVLAVYSYHLKGIGSAINWMQQPTNFLLVIVIPLVLLFIYNIVMFVRMIMQAKVAKVKEESGAAIMDEEEIKRKAIEEYLAKQNPTTDIADSDNKPLVDEEVTNLDTDNDKDADKE